MKSSNNKVGNNPQNFSKTKLLELNNEDLQKINGGHCSPLSRVHRPYFGFARFF